MQRDHGGECGRGAQHADINESPLGLHARRHVLDELVQQYRSDEVQVVADEANEAQEYSGGYRIGNR